MSFSKSQCKCISIITTTEHQLHTVKSESHNDSVTFKLQNKCNRPCRSRKRRGRRRKGRRKSNRRSRNCRNNTAWLTHLSSPSAGTTHWGSSRPSDQSINRGAALGSLSSNFWSSTCLRREQCRTVQSRTVTSVITGGKWRFWSSLTQINVSCRVIYQ